MLRGAEEQRAVRFESNNTVACFKRMKQGRKINLWPNVDILLVELFLVRACVIDVRKQKCEDVSNEGLFMSL